MAYNIGSNWCLRLSDGTEVATGSGTVTSFTPPTIKREFDTERRSGEIGSAGVFTGFAVMEGEFEYMGIQDELDAMLRKQKWITTTLRSVGNDYLQNEIRKEVIMTTYFMEFPAFSKVSQGLESNTVTFQCRAIRVNNIDPDTGTSDTVFKFEPGNYIYEVDGVNQLESLKTFLTCT